MSCPVLIIKGLTGAELSIARSRSVLIIKELTRIELSYDFMW